MSWKGSTGGRHHSRRAAVWARRARTQSEPTSASIDVALDASRRRANAPAPDICATGRPHENTLLSVASRLPTSLWLNALVTSVCSRPARRLSTLHVKLRSIKSSIRFPAHVHELCVCVCVCVCCNKQRREMGKKKKRTNQKQSEWGSWRTRTRRRPSTRRRAPRWPGPRSTRPHRGSGAGQPRAPRSRAPGWRHASACCRSSAAPQSSRVRPQLAARRSALSSTPAEDPRRSAAHPLLPTSTPRPVLCTATASVRQSLTHSHTLSLSSIP